MLRLRITNGFDKLSDASLEARAFHIRQCLDGNNNFTGLIPTLVNGNSFIDDYSTALSESQHGSRLQVAVKNQKRALLIDLLHAWGNCIVFLSEGDMVKAVSSGYTIAKVPSPKAPIEKPENIQLSQGINPGVLDCKAKRVKNSQSYLHQYATDLQMADNKWNSIPSTRSTQSISDLTPGIKYNYRLAVIGVRGQLLYSDVISRIVA